MNSDSATTDSSSVHKFVLLRYTVTLRLPLQAHLARPLFVGASAELEPVLAREFAEASFARGDKASG